MNSRRRVIKLGGSLLDWPRLPEAWSRWHTAQPFAEDWLVVGGGEFVEVLRQADRTHQLGESVCHDLSLRAMGLTARLAARVLPRTQRIEQLPSVLREAISPTNDRPLPVQILDPLLLQDSRLAASFAQLPASWDVTSDSIAAWWAGQLDAFELVLLKSALPEHASDRSSASRLHYVDPYFPQASQGLPRVRCVNLRAQKFPEQILLP